MGPNYRRKMQKEYEKEGLKRSWICSYAVADVTFGVRGWITGDEVRKGIQMQMMVVIKEERERGLNLML